MTTDWIWSFSDLTIFNVTWSQKLFEIISGQCSLIHDILSKKNEFCKFYPIFLRDFCSTWTLFRIKYNSKWKTKTIRIKVIDNDKDILNCWIIKIEINDPIDDDNILELVSNEIRLYDPISNSDYEFKWKILIDPPTRKWLIMIKDILKRRKNERIQILPFGYLPDMIQWKINDYFWINWICFIWGRNWIKWQILDICEWWVLVSFQSTWLSVLATTYIQNLDKWLCWYSWEKQLLIISFLLENIELYFQKVSKRGSINIWWNTYNLYWITFDFNNDNFKKSRLIEILTWLRKVVDRKLTYDCCTSRLNCRVNKCDGCTYFDWIKKFKFYDLETLKEKWTESIIKWFSKHTIIRLESHYFEWEKKLNYRLYWRVLHIENDEFTLLLSPKTNLSAENPDYELFKVHYSTTKHISRNLFFENNANILWVSLKILLLEEIQSRYLNWLLVRCKFQRKNWMISNINEFGETILTLHRT